MKFKQDTSRLHNHLKATHLWKSTFRVYVTAKWKCKFQNCNFKFWN